MKIIVVIILFLVNLFPIDSYSQTEMLVYQLTQKGTPLAIIQIPQSTGTHRSALFLQRCIQQSTDAVLPIISEDYTELPDKYNIIVHLAVKNDPQNKDLNLFDSDAFTINFADAKNIWITGHSNHGVEFGVYDFLERFIGFRWLFPGSLGEHIPRHESLFVKGKNIQESPVFISRRLSGMHGEDNQKWAQRHRMHDRIKRHHNLYNIYPVERYLKTHPHLYPQKDGLPNVPNSKTGWQPCFQNKDAIDIAVSAISDYFDKNPQMHTFSLSPNDAIHSSSGYCFSGNNQVQNNSWGYPDASDMYYSWANKVVSRLLRHYPGNLFGTIAYMELATPPQKVRVHHNIIPFLTEDRLRWVKPKCQNFAKKWVDSWAKQSQYIGFYDYIYGTPYVLPRVYFHHMAEVYQFAAQKGVRAIYAEAYPNWGEGPKLYLAVKLFWNPFLNVDHLLNDWYITCVGERAAPYLAEYFKRWETFWTQKIQDTDWFNNKSMYMAFWSPAYLDVCDISAIRQSRLLLEKTIEMSETSIQKKRAQFLLKTFEYYEATAISYWGLKKKSYGIQKNVANQMNDKRYELIKQFENNSLLNHPLRFDNNQRFPGLNWGSNAQ